MADYRAIYGKTLSELTRHFDVGEHKIRTLHKRGQLTEALRTGIVPPSCWARTLAKPPKKPRPTKVQEYFDGLSKRELIEDALNDAIAYIAAERSSPQLPKSRDEILEGLKAARKLCVA